MTQLKIRMRTGITLKTIQNYLKMKTEDIPPEKKIQSARKHEEATENKRKAVEEVRSLFEKGLPVSRISEITGHTPATIKRYLDQKFNPKDPCYDNFFPGKLGPYRQKVLELREKTGPTPKFMPICKNKVTQAPLMPFVDLWLNKEEFIKM
ncbi:hypothetical protein KQI58_19290 [Enterococcus raffinosus]|uniref:hypothetical protein n=1 Tax=Enterococcus raffinosus TaxID=71452 RepID=UPI001C1156C8|nr:hypothetical protein [Enterococcus raffinosus]MBU5363190.1 hypothetical protein [Enterococcus raffinosus]